MDMYSISAGRYAEPYKHNNLHNPKSSLLPENLKATNTVTQGMQKSFLEKGKLQ